MAVRTIRKAKGYIYASILKTRYEKRFECCSGFPIKYLLMDGDDQEYLVVVFSSFTRRGVPARYNYVKTLSDVNCTKLFILDDFGLDKRGSYYLGKNGGTEIYEGTRQLIREVKEKKGGKTTIYCGSSKGGWAALKFGVADPCGYVIAGAPQYYLGQYAVSEYEKPEGNKELLPYLSENLYDKSKLSWLDSLIYDEIRLGTSSNPVFLNYSVNEHTFEEHVCHLLEDLRSANRPMFIEEDAYVDHNDISLFFPDFLHRSITSILEEGL